MFARPFVSIRLLAVAGLCLAASNARAGSPDPASPSPAPSLALTNTIKWSTASEVDNFGYDVYRADVEAGPFKRLTKTPIRGAGTSDEVHKYQYVDSTNDPHREYYYYVESIALSGAREKFTPVIRAKAKQPKSPAPDAKASPTP
jgi:hypothetical protein